MRALILSNGKFEKREIKNTLAELQSIVGGYIEVPFISKELSDNGILVIVNEEGKFIDGLRAEIVITNMDNLVIDIVYGNCLFVSQNEDEFDSLSDEQIRIINKVFSFGSYGDDIVRAIKVKTKR